MEREHRQIARSWCEFFEQRLNAWLDARRPLQADVFFDPTPARGLNDESADLVESAGLDVAEFTVSASLAPGQAASQTSGPERTMTVPYAAAIRQLDAHVLNCSACQRTAIAYGELQNATATRKAPFPNATLVDDALNRIKLDSTAEALPAEAPPTVSVPQSAIETIPHLQPAIQTGSQSELREQGTSEGASSSFIASASPGSRRWLLKGAQIAAIAATLLIAVIIAINTPNSGPAVNDPGTRASADDSRAEDVSAPTRNGAVPWEPISPFSTITLTRTLDAFDSASMFPKPSGSLFDRARAESAQAWEEVSAGLAPLAGPTENAASFLGGLIPAQTLSPQADTAH